MSYRNPSTPRDVAIVAFGEWVFRVDPGTGMRIWYQHLQDAAGIARIVVVGDRVVVSVGTRIFCFDVGNGTPIWRAEAPIQVYALAVAEGVVLAGGSGEVAGFDLATGAPRWHDPFKNLGNGAVTIAAGDSVSGPQPMGKGVG